MKGLLSTNSFLFIISMYFTYFCGVLLFVHEEHDVCLTCYYLSMNISMLHYSILIFLLLHFILLSTCKNVFYSILNLIYYDYIKMGVYGYRIKS